MKFLKPILAVALASSLSVVNANAMGDREKGALIGAGAMLILPSMVQNLGVLFGGNQAIHSEPVRYHREPRPIVVERETVIIKQKHPKHDRQREYGRHYGKYNHYDRQNRYSNNDRIIIIER